MTDVSQGQISRIFKETHAAEEGATKIQTPGKERKRQSGTSKRQNKLPTHHKDKFYESCSTIWVLILMTQIKAAYGLTARIKLGVQL
ncbi:hypothetical protein HW555_010599 [Spodoptera exigua]|uniref:Uncharacterized protein n=1 Tax=Spodoptera exigua TaxID=7107 RepID=A0A835G8H8_SPOEX|nr:hypothetical protein HW555_010599 [Spodoptera exigua]